MSTYGEQGSIKEVRYGENFSYILSNANMFASEEYQATKTLDNDIFVRCEQRRAEEKVQLLYFTNGFQSLASFLPYMRPEMFYETAVEVYRSITEIRRHPVLQSKNIDLSLEHIYIDTRINKVRLIYVPLTAGFFYDEAYLEEDFRELFSGMIMANSSLASPQNVNLMAGLKNPSVPLDMVFGIPEEPAPVFQPTRPGLRLISNNMFEEIVLDVDKDEYVIGRSRQRADGIISGNNTVGRAHCKITYTGDGYVLEDLSSTNGTWLNQVELYAGDPKRLKDGDIILISDVELRVQLY